MLLKRRGRVPCLPQRLGDFTQNRRVVDRGRRPVLLAVGYLLHRPAQNLPRASLGKPLDHGRGLKGSDGTNLLAHHLDHLRRDFVVIPVRARIEHKKTDRQLPFQLVIDADDGALGDVGVPSQDFLHATGGQAVPGDIDDVVRRAMTYTYPSSSMYPASAVL